MADLTPNIPRGNSSCPSTPTSRSNSFSFRRTSTPIGPNHSFSFERSEVLEPVTEERPRYLTKSQLEDPNDYKLKDGEERCYLVPMSELSEDEREQLQNVFDTLKSWINFELSESRMQLSDLEDDLRDGLILAKLVGKLSKKNLVLPFGEYVQAEERQRNNLQAVCNQIKTILSVHNPRYFGIESISNYVNLTFF